MPNGASADREGSWAGSADGWKLRFPGWLTVLVKCVAPDTFWPSGAGCYVCISKTFGKSSHNSLLLLYFFSLLTTLLTGEAKIVSYINSPDRSSM